MNTAMIFVITAIMILLVIAGIMLLKKKWKTASPLTYLSISFVVIGIALGGPKLVVYGFLGTGILIALADQPFIPPEVINKLIEGFATGAQGIALPVYEGKRGHPVILDRKKYEREILALQGDVGGKEIVSRHPEDVLEVAVASKGVLIDIDAPEDYQGIQEGS